MAMMGAKSGGGTGQLDALLSLVKDPEAAKRLEAQKEAAAEAQQAAQAERQALQEDKEDIASREREMEHSFNVLEEERAQLDEDVKAHAGNVAAHNVAREALNEQRQEQAATEQRQTAMNADLDRRARELEAGEAALERAQAEHDAERERWGNKIAGIIALWQGTAQSEAG